MTRRLRTRMLGTAAMVYHLTDRDISALQAVAAAPWWQIAPTAAVEWSGKIKGQHTDLDELRPANDAA